MKFNSIFKETTSGILSNGQGFYMAFPTELRGNWSEEMHRLSEELYVSNSSGNIVLQGRYNDLISSGFKFIPFQKHSRRQPHEINRLSVGHFPVGTVVRIGSFEDKASVAGIVVANDFPDNASYVRVEELPGAEPYGIVLCFSRGNRPTRPIKILSRGDWRVGAEKPQMKLEDLDLWGTHIANKRLGSKGSPIAVDLLSVSARRLKKLKKLVKKSPHLFNAGRKKVEFFDMETFTPDPYQGTIPAGVIRTLDMEVVEVDGASSLVGVPVDLQPMSQILDLRVADRLTTKRFDQSYGAPLWNFVMGNGEPDLFSTGYGVSRYARRAMRIQRFIDSLKENSTNQTEPQS